MKTSADYKVSLGDIGRTVLYEDAQGTIRFTFDVETSNGQNKIILERGKTSTVEAERLRTNLASERTKQYLLSRGYQVEYYDG